MVLIVMGSKSIGLEGHSGFLAHQLAGKPASSVLKRKTSSFLKRKENDGDNQMTEENMLKVQLIGPTFWSRNLYSWHNGDTGSLAPVPMIPTLKLQNRCKRIKQLVEERSGNQLT